MEAIHLGEEGNPVNSTFTELRDYLAVYGIEDVYPLVEQMVKFDVPADLALKVVQAIATARLKT
jgi:hypothetical protein